MGEPRFWHARGYLPHYDDGRAIQMITYRLGDALPSEVLQKLDEQTLDDETRRTTIEQYLDAGHGSCVLRRPAYAQRVIDTWLHSNGNHYGLHAWVIMPNHVHVLVEPSNRSVGTIVRGWKSISARKIQQMNPAGRDGQSPLWQADYFDRFVRNENHYRAVIGYIHDNPVKAGFVSRPEDWPWSSAVERL